MDSFQHHQSGLSSPASDGFAITPSDEDDLPKVTRALHCAGQAGDVAVVFADGGEATIYMHQGGIFPARVKQVKLTGTEAQNLVGLV